MINTKKLSKYIALIILIFFSNLSALANFDEIKSDELKYKSAKLNCSCEYRLNTINYCWWENFSDPYLKKYVFLAIQNNHDLKKAALKTEEYRQEVKQEMSHELPNLTFAPGFARIKTARNQIANFEFAQTRSNIYALPFIASYEADIFLKNHDKTKAAKMEKQSAEYEEKAANISIAADTATLYINIIKLDKIIETQKKIAAIRKNIYELTKEREKSGLASVYDVTYTNRLHTQSEIELNDLIKQRNIYLHRLAVFIDTAPANAYNLPRGKFDNLEYKGEIPECIPSESISLRPDIMKAESDLKKAKIDIRVARKNFLPSFNIIGVAGYNSLLLERLFDWENIMALIAVGAFEKLYTGGNLTASLRIKKLKFEQLFEQYKQTELNAFQEINDVLCMIKYDTNKDSGNLKKLNLEKSNLNLVKERYKAGIISYLEYIQYQETTLSLQTEKDNSKAQRLADYISLYKAAGTKL